MLEYAAGLKLDSVQISHGSFVSLEEPDLLQVKALADRPGVQAEPGFGCICPQSKGWNVRQGDPVEYLRRCIRVAKVPGASCGKVYLGTAADRAGGRPIAPLIAATVPLLRAVRARAVVGRAGTKMPRNAALRRLF